jgi:phosphoserine aminotransferase
VSRVYNFSSGPAVLPVPVLEEIQRDLLALPSVGMSILEISHRSAAFEAILAQAEADVRTIARVPASYKVLFLQGGASTQFSMVPMNLLTPGATADYIDSGSWGDKAIKEAKKVGLVNVAASTKAEGYSRVPAQAELKLIPGAAYVHMTSNNTIEGTEYKALPDVGDVPLVNDTSSDMFSRPSTSTATAHLAGAQKNSVRRRVRCHPRRSGASAEKGHAADNDELRRAGGEHVVYNTPPTFGSTPWAGHEVALAQAAQGHRRRNARKAVKLTETIARVLSRHRKKASVAHERDVQAGPRISRSLRQGVTAAGLDGLKGTVPLAACGRPSGVSGGGSDALCPHARLRDQERIMHKCCNARMNDRGSHPAFVLPALVHY